jgi:hypothetical protein
MQPSRPREMDDQVQLITELKIKKFTHSLGTGQFPPENGGDRRVKGLKHADRGDVYPLDLQTDGAIAQIRG